MMSSSPCDPHPSVPRSSEGGRPRRRRRGIVLRSRHFDTVSACDHNLPQVTHPLDTQAALHRHHSPDLVVDALAPESPLFWRRASIFCKAPLKKSTSRVVSANTRFSCRYTARNGDFVLVVAPLGGDLEADGFQKFAETVGDALIEPVQLGALLVGEFAISRKRLQ
jgi:hypothetical protein